MGIGAVVATRNGVVVGKGAGGVAVSAAARAWVGRTFGAAVAVGSAVGVGSNSPSPPQAASARIIAPKMAEIVQIFMGG